MTRRSLYPRASYLLAVLGLTLAWGPISAVAQTATSEWQAELAGENEVPPAESTATGTFTATFDEEAETLEWSLSAPDATGVTAAHLHSGAAGTNGPIVLPLFAAPEDAPVNSLDESGTTDVAAELIGPFEGDFAGFVAALEAGEIYVNVHTVDNPAGEIRAQVESADGPAPTEATPTPTEATPAPTEATPAPTPEATQAPADSTPAAVPSAADTGNAGLGFSGGASAALSVLLVVLTGVIVAGGRLIGRQRN